MSDVVIKIENLSKQYRLGEVGTGTISHDLNRWWARILGKEDPFLKLGDINDRTTKGISDYVWALRNIDFDVNKGDVLGVIGKNGAGKSTLLKILSKTTSPTTGRIKIKGRIASLLEVGTGFHPEMTGRENIFLNGAILGMSRKEIKSKFDEIVDFAGIERYIDTPVKRYSSGMYVRLAFAVAAHLEPEILVVDEVLAVGDAEFQKKCLGKMKDVSVNDGRTVLFVSHNMAAVQNLCTSGIVLKEGHIAFYGSQNDAISNYLKLTNLNTNSLIDRTDRKGNGVLEITDISLQDMAGNKIDSVICGQDFDIVLSYDLKSQSAYDLDLTPGIILKNNYDIPVLLHHSRLVGKTFKLLNDKGQFIIRINKLGLVAGNYTLGYSIMSRGINLDSIEDAININIIDGDFYGYGEVPPSSHGFMLINADWIHT